ncbi:CheY-like chemotaxis protein [Devosia sp. UYZn731]
MLVVEDEGMIAMAIGDVLDEMGHHVCANAGTETDAVAASHRSNPDLIIIDCRLRIGSGIAAMSKILSHGYVPHIYISGDSLVAETLDRGAVVLQKPFSDIQLADAIASAMESRTVRTISGGDPQSSANGGY